MSERMFSEPKQAVNEAIERWEQKGPTSLNVALMVEALYALREIQELAWNEGYSARAENMARLMYEDGEPIQNPYRPLCHCGEPVRYGFDGDPTHHRGMCEHCDSVRCDAYPGECGR